MKMRTQKEIEEAVKQLEAMLKGDLDVLELTISTQQRKRAFIKLDILNWVLGQKVII